MWKTGINYEAQERVARRKVGRYGYNFESPETQSLGVWALNFLYANYGREFLENDPPKIRSEWLAFCDATEDGNR